MAMKALCLRCGGHGGSYLIGGLWRDCRHCDGGYGTWDDPNQGLPDEVVQRCRGRLKKRASKAAAPLQ